MTDIATADDGPKIYTARAELTLARDDAYPLRSVPLKPDPVQQIAEAFRLLDPDQSEQLEVITDLVPMTRAAARKRRREAVKALQEQPRGTAGKLGQFMNPGGGPSGGVASKGHQFLNPGAATQPRPSSTSTAAQSNRRDPGLARLDQVRQERLLADTLADPEPHFWFQMFIRARSENKQRAAALLQATLAALDQFDGHNELRVVGLRLPFRFLSADSIFRRHRFDRRIDKWRFKKRNNAVVGVSEIAGLLKPATVHCNGDNVIRTGGILPPPPRHLIPYDLERPPHDAYLVGAVKRGQTEQTVGVPLDETFFTYSPGRTRWGKTEANLARFLALARSGRCATLFLDPHDDALTKVKPYLADQADRIIELSTARRSDGARTQIGWNPFAKARLQDPDAVSAQTDLVVNSIAAAMAWGNSTAPRTLALTRNSVQALMEISTRLPDHTAPTIFQIPTLLNDEDWRHAVIPHLSGTLRRFWGDVYPKYGDEAQLPLAGFISRIAGIPRVAALLGSSISNYHARTAIDQGAIILVRLGGNTDIDQLMASLVVWDLKAAVMSRYDTAPERRRPVHAWFDEVQDYDGAIRGQISDILEQTAKFGMRLHLLNQQPTSLQKKTLSAALTNRSHLFATLVNEQSSKLLARNMSPTLSPAAIQDTPRYNFIAQVTIDGEVSQPFRCRGVGLEEAFGPAPGPTVAAQVQHHIDTNSGRRPIDEILAELETLDQRIYDHLQRVRAASPAANQTPPVQTTDGSRITIGAHLQLAPPPNTAPPGNITAGSKTEPRAPIRHRPDRIRGDI